MSSARTRRGGKVSRYRLLQPIGHDPLGETWRGQDSVTGAPVAIKVVGESIAHDHAISKRVRAEVRDLVRPLVLEGNLSSKISHTNAVRVLASSGDDPDADPGDDEDSGLIIVMEPLDGRLLTDALTADGPLDLGEAARIAAEVAAALAAAHAAGVVHGCIHPGNVLISPWGRALLMDFGLIGVVMEVSPAHEAMSSLEPYLAPEQRGGSAHRSFEGDVYSLGALLFTMLTARPPQTEPSESVDGLPEHVPGEIAEICLRCLAEVPNIRPTVTAFGAAVSPFARPHARSNRPAVDLSRENGEPVVDMAPVDQGAALRAASQETWSLEARLRMAMERRAQERRKRVRPESKGPAPESTGAPDRRFARFEPFPWKRPPIEAGGSDAPDRSVEPSEALTRTVRTDAPRAAAVGARALGGAARSVARRMRFVRSLAAQGMSATHRAARREFTDLRSRGSRLVGKAAGVPSSTASWVMSMGRRLRPPSRVPIIAAAVLLLVVLSLVVSELRSGEGGAPESLPTPSASRQSAPAVSSPIPTVTPGASATGGVQGQASGVPVPSLTGLTAAQARLEVLRAGLVLGEAIPVPGVPGIVVGSQPGFGERVPKGTEVVLLIGASPERISTEP